MSSTNQTNSNCTAATASLKHFDRDLLHYTQYYDNGCAEEACRTASFEDELASNVFDDCLQRGCPENEIGDHIRSAIRSAQTNVDNLAQKKLGGNVDYIETKDLAPIYDRAYLTSVIYGHEKRS